MRGLVSGSGEGLLQAVQVFGAGVEDDEEEEDSGVCKLKVTKVSVREGQVMRGTYRLEWM